MMKKTILVGTFLALVGWLLAGCGTMTIGGHPAVGFESEKDKEDKEGKTVPAFGTVIRTFFPTLNSGNAASYH